MQVRKQYVSFFAFIYSIMISFSYTARSVPTPFFNSTAMESKLNHYSKKDIYQIMWHTNILETFEFNHNFAYNPQFKCLLYRE